MSTRDSLYSIVVPVYNSGDNLLALVDDFKRVFSRKYQFAELILVDDASNEATSKIAEILAAENKNVTTIRLKKNSGQLAATTCGILHARGKIIITMDDDLQYPMDEALRLCEYFHKSRKKIVFGFPRTRMHSFQHRIMAGIVIFLFDYILLPRYRKVNFYTPFRIFYRSLIYDGKSRATTRHLFFVWEIPVSLMGSIEVTHQARRSGYSTYTFAKKIRVLSPPIYFCFMRLSIILLPVLMTIFSTMLLFGVSQIFLYYVMMAAFVFFVITAIASKILLEKSRKIEYDIEKVTQ